MWLSLVLLVTFAADPVAPGRKALESLEYEKALRLLLPVANDEERPRPVRAKAFVLVAQAHFGIAAPEAEDRARAALRSAFRLDRNVELVGRDDVSPKLVALYDEFRAQRPKPRGNVEAEDDEPAERPPTTKTTSTTTTTPSTETTTTTTGTTTTEPLSAEPAEAPTSPWLIGAVVAGAVAGVGAVSAVGSELWLSAVPPGSTAEQVRGVQAVGMASVVVFAAAGVAAVAASAVAVGSSDAGAD